MFEQILPHQIVLLWLSLAGLVGFVSGILISEANKQDTEKGMRISWLYVLGNTSFCAFAGVVAGGIFVGLTDALVWAAWSLLIPIFMSGIVSWLVYAFLADDIPKQTVKVKPAATILSIVVLVLLALAAIYPATFGQPEATSGTVVDNAPVYRVTSDNVDVMTSTSSMDAIDSSNLNVMPTTLDWDTIQSLETNPTKPIEMESHHTSIDFPVQLAENPAEGDYMKFKFDFSVPSSSPSAWQQPVTTWMVWGDADGNGDYGSGDYVLDSSFFKIPNQAGDETGSIYMSSPCLYKASDGSPQIAFYTAQDSDGNIQMLPCIFGMTFTDSQGNVWKDDSQYTFSNTPEGYTPPYDMWSWEYYEADNTIQAQETYFEWTEIAPSDTASYPVIGEIYIGSGMSEINDWYVTCIAYDWAYSQSEPVASHKMHFQVGAAQPPDVNVSSSWWVEAALFGLIGVACIGVVKYGKQWL